MRGLVLLGVIGLLSVGAVRGQPASGVVFLQGSTTGVEEQQVIPPGYDRDWFLNVLRQEANQIAAHGAPTYRDPRVPVVRLDVETVKTREAAIEWLVFKTLECYERLIALEWNVKVKCVPGYNPQTIHNHRNFAEAALCKDQMDSGRLELERRGLIAPWGWPVDRNSGRGSAADR